MSRNIDSLFSSLPAPKGAKRKAPNDLAASYKTQDDSSNIKQDEEDNKEPGGEVEENDTFYGDGLSKRQREILDYMEEHDTNTSAAIEPEKYDQAWIRRQCLRFEKSLSKNIQLRSEFPDEPSKFLNSEADLHESIRSLSPVIENANKLYPDLGKLNTISSIISLLSHDNTDIASDAVQLLAEMTDDDVAIDEQVMLDFIDALLDNQLIESLVTNLQRLDEDKSSSDADTVYKTFELLENLLAFPRPAAEMLNRQDSQLLDFIMRRISKQEATITANRQYAAELISILVISDPGNAHLLLANSNKNMDTLLQEIALFRRRDPEKGLEEEFMENIFDTLYVVAQIPGGKEQLLQLEGVELALLLTHCPSFNLRTHAIRLVRFSLAGGTSGPVAVRLVESDGLKSIFRQFLKVSKHNNSKRQNENGDVILAFLDIFASLLRCLPLDSPTRLKTLGKFLERDYAVLQRILELRAFWVDKIQPILSRMDAEIDSIKQDTKDEDDDKIKQESAHEISRIRIGYYLELEDAGVYNLQVIDQILAWLIAEDYGFTPIIKKGVPSLQDIKATLLTYRDALIPDSQMGAVGINAQLSQQQKELQSSNGQDEFDETKDMVQMLETLSEFL